MSNTTNNSIGNVLRYWYVLVVFVILVFICAQSAHAFTMSNDNWILQMGNFNSAAGKPTSDKYKLGFTSGETAPGLFSGTNYKVRSGFQYISSIIRFSFTISETTIDFGGLTPTNPVTRSNSLTVSNGSAHGYSVTATEDHPLQIPGTSTLIPDTTCDDGTCTESTSANWSNTLTYGFGYRCDNLSGTDCVSGFTNSSYYKQFADRSKNEDTQVVMSGLNVGRNKKAQITYKINISGTQLPGSYSNRITYIATPTF